MTFFLTEGFGQKIVTAVEIFTPPSIDGMLNDSVWSLAVPNSEFLQQEPKAGENPTFKTEIRILYDKENLYLGIMCYDPEPDKIVARELKRDGNLRGDDNIMMIFDTFNDDRNAYWFGTNPLGMRDDAILYGFDYRSFNEEWHGIWDVSSAIVDSGWSTELVFPFSTFKFHDKDEQTWGFNLLRQIRRLNEQAIWSAAGKNLGLFRIAFAGDLVGIKKIKRGDPIYIKPFLTGGFQQGESVKKKNFEPGLDIKYGITQNFSLDLTFNTDFAQVESDRARINLTQFPLFFPEKREFFLENANVFDYTFGAGNNLFYSRRIGISDEAQIPIIAGARLVGRIQKVELGVMNIQTEKRGAEPTTNYGVVRMKYDLFDQSYAGFIFTNKISKNKFNRVYAGDFNFTFSEIFGDQTMAIGGGVMKSEDTDGGKNSWGSKFFINYPNDLINFFTSHRYAQKDFNPGIGFMYRTGFQSLVFNLKVSPRINWNEVKRLNFEPIESDIYWNDKGELSIIRASFVPIGLSTNADDNLEFKINRRFDFLESDFNIFDTTVIPIGKYWYTSYEVDLETSRSRKIYGGVEYSFGDYLTGKKKSFSLNVSSILSKHLSISADYETNTIKLREGIFTTNEFGTRIRYDFTTMIYSSIFAQWNNEENEININYRFNWQPKIGSDFYLVVNHMLSTGRKFRTKDIAILAKIVWLFVI
ncbi:MAG: carbohydrate binding family 9 domain-containing protein [Ignavibacteria bacterium]|nr:carbohydrate binding family 9 domain-containing protein [Ignavibacteria bacterium]MBM4176406.1 carbohydrate binding family 9 domain-containing protein [Ignavibacteria bacterium]